jgi:hypothetical protein
MINQNSLPKILYLFLVGMIWIFNPLPRHLKVVYRGRYVLDIRGRYTSNKIQRSELARRRLAGEEERQCFTISQAGSVDVYGTKRSDG